MNDISENFYNKVLNVIPESKWYELVTNRLEKSVDSQKKYIALKISLDPELREEAKILRQALIDNYIPYHIVIGFQNQIEFLPLKLIITIKNINELKLFTFGSREYYNTEWVLCFDRVPLHVILEYSKIIGADY